MGRKTYMALDRQVVAVAVEGAVGDWSAYIGAVSSENHEREWEEVARSGSKLPRRVAEVLFPQWASRFEWRR